MKRRKEREEQGDNREEKNAHKEELREWTDLRGIECDGENAR